MNPLQNWLNQDRLFPMMPPVEQIGIGLAAASVVSSLAMDSPLSMVMRIGAVTGS